MTALHERMPNTNTNYENDLPTPGGQMEIGNAAYESGNERVLERNHLTPAQKALVRTALEQPFAARMEGNLFDDGPAANAPVAAKPYEFAHSLPPKSVSTEGQDLSAHNVRHWIRTNHLK